MQADQTVLSLRPGGGGGGGGGANRGNRFLGPRFDSSSSSPFGSSSDLPVLRPHGGVPSAFSIKVYKPPPVCWI